MTLTVPTWTLVVPIYVVLVITLFVAIRYIDSRWISPWVYRRLAKRLGISVEELNAARERLRDRREKLNRRGGA